MLFKGKKNLLFVGMELNNESAQISYCRSEKPEPETLSMVTGEEQFSIPAALCKCYGANQWYFGKDALRHAKDGDGILIDRLWERALIAERIEADGEQYDAVSLLSLFVRRCISVMMLGSDADMPDEMMITVENLNEKAIAVLSKVGEYLQMDREHLVFQSYAESFYEYCMRQPEELRTHEVLVCDFAASHLKTYRLEFNRTTSPVTAFIEEKEFPAMRMPQISGDDAPKEAQAQKMDREFAKIVDSLISGRIITCVYLIGGGFQKDWYQESLRLLCSRRRVFQGNNLYSKGACYAAYGRVHKSDIAGKYLFLGKDKIKVRIDLDVSWDGKDRFEPLIDAGINWFDAQKEIDVLLESGRKISFVLSSLYAGQKKRLTMELEGLPERPENTTRLKIRVRFSAENCFYVRVDDLGFGQLFASSGLSWEEKVEL